VGQRLAGSDRSQLSAITQLAWNASWRFRLEIDHAAPAEIGRQVWSPRR
jgi:hypothetical protein